jgi:hypothetical protein
MSYKIEKPEGAPPWFVPGIVCRVKDSEEDVWKPEPLIIAWYSKGWAMPFRGINCGWHFAEPVEVWEPQLSEAVAVWSEGNEVYHVVPYDTYDSGATRSGLTAERHTHIAHYSGQLDMHVEALKDEPRWKP